MIITIKLYLTFINNSLLIFKVLFTINILRNEKENEAFSYCYMSKQFQNNSKHLIELYSLNFKLKIFKNKPRELKISPQIFSNIFSLK